MALARRFIVRMAKSPSVNCVRHMGWKDLFYYSPKKGFDVDVLAKLHQPIDMSPAAIDNYLKQRNWDKLVKMQSYDANRTHVLGRELAAAHFIVAQGGAIKTVRSRTWVELTEDKKILLPNSQVADFKLEAIDAAGLNLIFESFDTLEKLGSLRYLSLRGCRFVDDWCMDRLSEFRETLQFLDISECPRITHRGVASLHRLQKLKRLRMSDMSAVKNIKLMAMSIEETIPGCLVEGVDYSSLLDEELEEDEVPTLGAPKSDTTITGS